MDKSDFFNRLVELIKLADMGVPLPPGPPLPINIPKPKTAKSTPILYQELFGDPEILSLLLDEPSLTDGQSSLIRRLIDDRDSIETLSIPEKEMLDDLTITLAQFVGSSMRQAEGGRLPVPGLDRGQEQEEDDEDMSFERGPGMSYRYTTYS